MKQEITSEKKKELELKLKKSMLNFKMFSLMKKQLFSLVMMLALIVIASTSAWAQDGLTVTSAYWHMPGSTHGVTVDSHTNATYVWGITAANCDGTEGAAAEAGTTITSGSNTATITYSANATGVYRVTCIEAYGGCQTIRQFYTAVMNINVVVTSTLADGTTPANASDCNDYDERGPGSIDWLVPNLDADDNGGTAADLEAHINATNLYNTRWVHVVLSVSDDAGCPGIAGMPSAADLAWRFNYTIAGSPVANTEYTDNFIGLQTSIPAGAVYSAPATYDGTATVAVPEGTTAITIPMWSNIRWGLTDTDADQPFTFAASSVVVDDDGNADYTDGGESAANALVGNESSAQTIEASPATPRITIND